MKRMNFLFMEKLNNLKGPTRYNHVPDWYEQQRLFTRNQLINNTYYFEDDVYIESLRNAKGFIKLGDGKLTHKRKGIRLIGNDIDGPLDLFRSSNSLYSIHIEFMFKKLDKTKGAAVVISTENDTYYVYPKNKKRCFNKNKVCC